MRRGAAEAGDAPARGRSVADENGARMNAVNPNAVWMSVVRTNAVWASACQVTVVWWSGVLSSGGLTTAGRLIGVRRIVACLKRGRCAVRSNRQPKCHCHRVDVAGWSMTMPEVTAGAGFVPSGGSVRSLCASR
ncbi:hypothetical protein EDC35_104117 [Thiobaca trueperi]|uniref:Uncharacterized protein n=1 Tax=Thiobaca trueperi TaxID=127458 RepID=A0A4V2V1J1_9GAMM|nr:hypothetical protein EDC35_104117 [Thiobaca trueperi]